MEISPYCLLSLLPIFLLSGFSLSCNSLLNFLMICFLFLTMFMFIIKRETIVKKLMNLNVQMMNLMVTQQQAELFFRQGQVKIILPN